MKEVILNKLYSGEDFNQDEIDYIESNYVPNFECDCGWCRWNLCLSLDLDPIEVLGLN